MRFLTLAAAVSSALAFETIFKFNASVQVETRSLDDIYQAAKAEGNVVTVWHGGDSITGGDALKEAFEKRFPGITLNITIDLSKYHDVAFDQDLVNNNVQIDSIILQTLHDFPRWAQEGALLNYAPAGFNAIDPALKDTDAAWYGVYIYAWSIISSTSKLANGTTVAEFTDFLKPELKDKIVLTYPHDDDAVLYAFDLILRHYGTQWFDALIAQNPKWVRGSGTPVNVIQNSSFPHAATFTADVGYDAVAGLEHVYPKEAPFVAWAQTAAIPANAPHPEGAKLLHNYLLSPEFQETTGWQVRNDLPLPQGFPYPPLANVTQTNAPAFARWMEDRGRVERLRFWFERRLGTPQGVSPLIDETGDQPRY